MVTKMDRKIKKAIKKRETKGSKIKIKLKQLLINNS